MSKARSYKGLLIGVGSGSEKYHQGGSMTVSRQAWCRKSRLPDNKDEVLKAHTHSAMPTLLCQPPKF